MRKVLPLLAAGALIFAGCGEKTYSEATVDFLKVGKADAAIIRTKEHTVLIDCAEKSDVPKITDVLDKYGITKIDCVILTHYDQDHIGGAAKIVKNYDVEHIISPRYKEGSKEFDKLKEEMDKKDIEFTQPKEDSGFTYDDVRFDVYPCRQNSYRENNDNNHSIVVKMTHGEKVFLFTGDATEDRLNEIMDIGDCDVLKEPYHGREIANLGEFLDKTTPEYVVISTDKATLAPSVKELCESKGIETYVTYKAGNIHFSSDGKTVTHTE